MLVRTRRPDPSPYPTADTGERQLMLTNPNVGDRVEHEDQPGLPGTIDTISNGELIVVFDDEPNTRYNYYLTGTDSLYYVGK